MTRIDKLIKKLDNDDLKWICKKLYIKYRKNESREKLIKKILLPLKLSGNKKYKMTPEEKEEALRQHEGELKLITQKRKTQKIISRLKKMQQETRQQNDKRNQEALRKYRENIRLEKSHMQNKINQINQLLEKPFMNKYIKDYKVTENDTYENIRKKYKELNKIYENTKRNYENINQLSVQIPNKIPKLSLQIPNKESSGEFSMLQIPNETPSLDINQIQNFNKNKLKKINESISKEINAKEASLFNKFFSKKTDKFVNKSKWIYERLNEIINKKNFMTYMKLKLPNRNLKEQFTRKIRYKVSSPIEVNIFLWGLFKYLRDKCQTKNLDRNKCKVNDNSNIFLKTSYKILNDIHKKKMNIYVFKDLSKLDGNIIFTKNYNYDVKEYNIWYTYNENIDYEYFDSLNKIWNIINGVYVETLKNSKKSSELFSRNFFIINSYIFEILQQNNLKILLLDMKKFVKNKINNTVTYNNVFEYSSIEKKLFNQSLNKKIINAYTKLIEETRNKYFELMFKYQYIIDLNVIKLIQKNPNFLFFNKIQKDKKNKIINKDYEKKYILFKPIKIEKKMIEMIKLYKKILKRNCNSTDDIKKLSNCNEIGLNNEPIYKIKINGYIVPLYKLLETNPISNKEKKIQINNQIINQEQNYNEYNEWFNYQKNIIMNKYESYRKSSNFIESFSNMYNSNNFYNNPMFYQRFSNKFKQPSL